MANVFYPNFPIPSSANVMQVIWKLTRAMKKAGWNTVAHSDGITKVSAGTNLNDSWGSNVDPSSDVYPSAFDTTNAPWIVMSGPKTLKIPLSANPTGTLLRGEKITQATSAAEGELLGYVWSVADSSGWAVVLPRTGTFNNTNIVTGATSTATFTPTGTIITYNREIMYGKTTANDTVNGQIWYVCCDPVGESTSLFSYLATQTGCTAIVPPGSGGTNNEFPTFGNAASPTGGAIAIRGTGGSTTATSWFGATSGYIGSAQITCVNAIPSAGISADGSFYIAMDCNIASGLAGIAYQRVDDGEPGDVDPYVFCTVTDQPSPLNWVRTQNLSSYGTTAVFAISTNYGIGTQNQVDILGYTARGLTISSSVRDIAQGAFATYTSASVVAGTAFKIANHPSVASTPMIREKLIVWFPGTVTNGIHSLKGKFRWLFTTSQGAVLQTSDSNTFLCVGTKTTSSFPALWIGPYDGVSTPV